MPDSPRPRMRRTAVVPSHSTRATAETPLQRYVVPAVAFTAVLLAVRPGTRWLFLGLTLTATLNQALDLCRALPVAPLVPGALTAAVMPALAVGNTVIAVPSETYPLITGELYQLFDTSDLPGGAVNIVTGYASQLLKTLAEHDDVDAIWYAGPPEGQAMVQRASAGNMKRTWVLPASGPLPHADEILREATQVKNIWVPYGG